MLHRHRFQGYGFNSQLSEGWQAHKDIRHLIARKYESVYTNRWHSVAINIVGSTQL